MSSPLSESAHNPEADKTSYQQQPAAGGAQGATPSGPKGDNPGTAGPGPTEVKSKTPENRTGHINPSAPEDANVTPGSMNEK
ncbi:MAG: hypothetical protein M3Y50_01240 [Acidobacteriota bacterium]|nr:hypothetical protein [Acidobacteriota bacterium]